MPRRVTFYRKEGIEKGRRLRAFLRKHANSCELSKTDKQLP